MSKKSIRTRMDEQRKDRTDPKVSEQRNRSKKLQTRNLPNDDVENINRTNKTFTTRQQAMDCSLRNRIDAAKSQEA